MADEEVFHLRNVHEFRKVLVAHRRNIISTALELRASNADYASAQPWYGAQWGKELLEVQMQIDALDKAIQDEERY